MTSTIETPKPNSPGSFFYPTSWPVDLIQPKLLVYRRNNGCSGTTCTATVPLIIPYSVDPIAMCHLLSENGYLSPATRRIVIATHGFRNTVDTPWMTEMKDELLHESDQTVILLGWGNGADLVAPHYLQAAANIQSVSDWLADRLTELLKYKNDLVVWGIGHSLGAHLLGLAGRKSRAFTRISGMDPAGPGFEKHEFLQYRLQPTDATIMTDVIHTDGYDSFLDPEDWISPVNHYGTLIPIGTVDFYPNFGYSQPGTGPISTLTIAGSHLRAIELFIWSIKNPGKFKTNWILDGTPGFETPVKTVKEIDVGKAAEMGYYAWKEGQQLPMPSGNYYLKTNKKEPWNYDPTSDCSGSKNGGIGCKII